MAHAVGARTQQRPSFSGFLREEGLNALYRTATTIGGAGQILLGGAICTTGVGCAAGGGVIPPFITSPKSRAKQRRPISALG